MIKVEKLTKGRYFDDAYKVSFNYDIITLNKIKTLENRNYLPEDRAWEIPSTELPNLMQIFQGEILLDDNLLAEQSQDKRERTQERLRGIKPIREFEFKTKPLPHQIEAFNYGMTHNFMLIGDQQGLGKTKESIDITAARKSEIGKCLIVCGVNSVKYNWQAEIKTHSSEQTELIDDKTMELRVAHIKNWLESEAYYGIINIESIRNTDVQDILCESIRNQLIRATIVDEIHKAKNGQSIQGKALKLLRTPIKIGLTGTPIMNKAEDLWNILTWLGVEKRNIWQFRKYYCIMGGFNGYQVVSHKNLDELHHTLNKVMLRRTKYEVLDLPPKTYRTEYVELRDKLLYRQIKEGIVAELEDILKTPNPLTCTLRLRQLTSGDPLLTENTTKLDRIKEMLEEDIIPNKEKAIIFSQWSTVAKVVNDALTDYNPILITGEVNPAKRQELVNEFQTNPECKVAVGTIGAMGTGLTLNKATYVFFIDKAWTSGENEQAEDRAHRIGTEGTVTIISMVMKNTLDEGIEDYLREKKSLFDKIVDGICVHEDVKELIYKLLNL